ncbi:MAG: hypothetical protein SPE88_06785 [Paludibacteraceae bacterium]|nr:hypothetical protein [Paludibacteraceae bacterium]
MKKQFLTLALCAATIVANATIIVNETFSYDSFPAEGSGWTQSGSVTPPGNGRTLTGALTYQNAGGEYALSKKGKALKSNYSAGDKYIATKEIAKQSSGVIYLTYLYQADGDQTQANSAVFGLSGSTTSAALRVWVGKNTDGKGDPFRMGITRASGKGDSVQWSKSTYAVSDVHLVVVKYDFANKAATLYVDPKLGAAEPETPAAVDSTMGEAKTSFSYLCFYATGSSKANFLVGGVRVSDTWEEAVEAVAAEPEPTVATVNTDFTDETWGEIVTKNDSGKYDITSGKFPSNTINGFILTKAFIGAGSITDATTEIEYTNRIVVDKQSQGGMVTTPLLTNVGSVEVVLTTGSDKKKVSIQYFDNESMKWKDCEETFAGTKAVMVKKYQLNRNQPTKIRIVNADSGTLYIWKIATTAYGETPTAIESTTTPAKAVKRIVNGQLVIDRDGVLYNVMGTAL